MLSILIVEGEPLFAETLRHLVELNPLYRVTAITDDRIGALASVAERLGKDSLTCWQVSRRGGYLTGRIEGDRVILGGKCVTIIDGVMHI